MTLKEITARVDECTGVTQPAAARSEAQKRNLATILSVMRIPENMLVRHMQAATYVLRELAPGIGRSRGVFSNRNVRYQGAPDDAALNRDVERFDAAIGRVHRADEVQVIRHAEESPRIGQGDHELV